MVCALFAAHALCSSLRATFSCPNSSFVEPSLFMRSGRARFSISRMRAVISAESFKVEIRVLISALVCSRSLVNFSANSF